MEEINGKPISPDYYHINIRDTTIDAMDIIDALGFNFNLGCVQKYLVRAGRKPKTPRLQDMEKALDCLMREVLRLRTLESLGVKGQPYFMDNDGNVIPVEGSVGDYYYGAR